MSEYYGGQTKGRPMKPEKAYLKGVQGIYKNYCFHVHNPDFVNNETAKEEDLKRIPSRFHKHLCNTVQEFVERPTDKAYEILIINTPPQVGKSTSLTETFPSWYLMKHPDESVIQVSYGDDLAERFGKRNLEKVKEYGNIFGVQVDPKKATSREFQILGRRGRMISKGIGSGLTGHSGHLIIIDDPIKNREQADSESVRDSVWDEFADSILTRTQAGSKIILIMTRWHEDDLAGRILENMPEVTQYVNYECECESDDDPLGRRKATEDKVGEPLVPELGKDENWLIETKKNFIAMNGLRTWNALYQGHPTIAEGNILKKEWWQPYEVERYFEGTLKFDQMIMSVDATFKDGEKNDYVCIQVWGKKENRMYLVENVNEHLDFTKTVHRIRLLKARFPRIGAILIEDKANGSAIINVLKHEILGIIPIQPDASKESRVNAVSFSIEAGNVYVPTDREWKHKFIEQCAKFPNDKHDDMVDAMSQALSRLIFSRKGRVRGAFKSKIDSWSLPSDRPKKKVDVGNTIHAI